MRPPYALSLRLGITRSLSLAAGLVSTLAACHTNAAPKPLTPAQMVARDGGIPPFTPADVEFMQGMIGHHAQAVTMAKLAVPNDASSEVRVLAGRIAVAQTDEIDFMANWLRTRKQTVPEGDAMMHHQHEGMEMTSPMMPGMLSTAQMDTLARAKGPAFDWYFLTYMIQHHRGAISMVDVLMAGRFAANDDNVFKFVSDVVADQSTEIARMELMLRSRSKP